MKKVLIGEYDDNFSLKILIYRKVKTNTLFIIIKFK